MYASDVLSEMLGRGHGAGNYGLTVSDARLSLESGVFSMRLQQHAVKAPVLIPQFLVWASSV